MLAAKRSVGVASEVNLRNQLHTGNEAGKQGIHSDFEIIVHITRRFSTRYIRTIIHMIRDWSKELDFNLSLA